VIIDYTFDTSKSISGFSLYTMSYHPSKTPAWKIRLAETRQGSAAAISKLPLPDEPLVQIRRLKAVPDNAHLARLWASATMCTSSQGENIAVISGGAGIVSTPPLLFFNPSKRTWKSVGGITTDETAESFTSKARWQHGSITLIVFDLL